MAGCVYSGGCHPCFLFHYEYVHFVWYVLVLLANISMCYNGRQKFYQMFDLFALACCTAAVAATGATFDVVSGCYTNHSRSGLLMETRMAILFIFLSFR
jgi:hypothetical protein